MSDSFQDFPWNADPEMIETAELAALGFSVKYLSRKYCVTERAIRYRLATPACRAVLVFMRKEQIRAMTCLSTAYGKRAVQTIAKLMKSNDERVQLNASKVVTDLVLETRLNELDERVAALEGEGLPQESPP